MPEMRVTIPSLPLGVEAGSCALGPWSVACSPRSSMPGALVGIPSLQARRGLTGTIQGGDRGKRVRGHAGEPGAPVH